MGTDMNMAESVSGNINELWVYVKILYKAFPWMENVTEELISISMTMS